MTATAAPQLPEQSSQTGGQKRSGLRQTGIPDQHDPGLNVRVHVHQ